MKACEERNSTFLLQGMQHPERHRKEHSNRVHPKAILKEPLKVSLTACIWLFALSHMISTGYCYTHAVEPHRQQQRHRSELERCQQYGATRPATRSFLSGLIRTFLSLSVAKGTIWNPTLFPKFQKTAVKNFSTNLSKSIIDLLLKFERKPAEIRHGTPEQARRTQRQQNKGVAKYYTLEKKSLAAAYKQRWKKHQKVPHFYE